MTDFNILDFVCEGDPDHSLAFRRAYAAAEAAGGGTIHVPPGEYRLPTMPGPPENVSVVGAPSESNGLPQGDK